MKKANNIEELLSSIHGGEFTLDGRHLIVTRWIRFGHPVGSVVLGLTSLKGCPQRILTNFDCSYNRLTSLKGGPVYVDADYSCDNNPLTTLKGCPDVINGNFLCSWNSKLTSSKGGPSMVKGDAYYGHCKIDTVEGLPRTIGGTLNINANHLTSLHNIHKYVNYIGASINVEHNQFEECMLGLLLIEGLSKIYGNSPLFNILNRYVGQGKANLYKCAQELINERYEKYAKL